MGRKYTDNALTTLASSILAGAQTLAVAAGKGDNFPPVTGKGAAGSTPDWFVITLEDAAGNREKMRVEQRPAGNDTLGSVGYPLVRGFDGTAARAWTAGDSVDLRWEKSEAQDALDKIEASGQGWQFGTKGSTTSGLNYGYYGGVINVLGTPTNIADGIVALTLSQTNFVERDAAGLVSANIVGFTAGRFPMAQVVADANGFTSITDKRASGLLVQPTLVNPNHKNQTLVDAATIAWDMSKGTVAKVTLGANRIMGLPTNIVAGSFGWLDIIQDGTGNRTLTSWNAIFKHPLGTVPVLSTAAGARDRFFWSTFDGSAIDLTMAKGMA